MNSRRRRDEKYPSALWRRKGPRRFLLGYIGVLIVLSILDKVLVGFSYLRLVEILLVVLYGFAWLIAYKLKPRIFD
jgi:hypothetical protein